MRARRAFLPNYFLFILWLIFTSVIARAQTEGVVPRIAEPVDNQNLVRLKGNTHPLARPEFDRGPAPPTLPMERMLLVLTRSTQQEAALEALLNEQQSQNSPNYHKWLTPEQFGLEFGPASADIQSVTNWLASQGFQVNKVSNGRTVIEFSGDAGLVRNAFHTEIHKFVVNGEEHWANVQDPQIPSALAPVVAGVVTLHNFPRRAMHRLAGVFRRSKDGKVKPVKPLFTFPGGCDLDGNCYAVGPYDFATIYNVLPLWTATPAIDGTGQTIAIVGQSNINVQDVRDFRNLFGLPANDPVIVLDGPDPGLVPGDETEADLDVEWSGAVAKGASVKLVASASTDTTAGVDLSAVYVVDNNIAPVISESFGDCELNLGTAGNQFYKNLWQQAAAQGITVFVSSGDNGSAGCDFNLGFVPQPAQNGLRVSGIASTPYNVAVGGTDFNDFFNPLTYWSTTNNPTTQASALSYIPETTWNDSCTNAIFGDPRIGFSTNAETNCNNLQLSGFVFTIGGSGGNSNCTTPTGTTTSTCAGGYAKPTWQTGAGVPSDSKRDIPDVSLFASNGFVGNFYMMCEADISFGSCSTFNFIGIGGTSASSPAFAGLLAMVNQKTAARQGNANFVFYKLAAQQSASSCNSSSVPASTCVFNDITSGTIAMPCAKGSPNCTTSNSADQYGVLSGYSTTTGYDLATGLGSVKANNLINNWGSITFKPTTSTLTLSPTANLPHGTAVNVNITVAPQTAGAGTPTGQVSLITSNNQGVTDFTLSNGSVSTTTNLLPGGTYTVTAHYGGDGTFAASDSTPPVAVTITPENSTTTVKALTADANGKPIPFTGGPYGGFVFLRADVKGVSGNGAATGTVNFTDSLNSGTPSNLTGDPYALNSEGYTVTPNGVFTLPPGAHSIAANYSGDPSFNPSSTTTPASFTITQAQTSTSACCTDTAPGVIFGSGFILSANISGTSCGNPPTGNVTFFTGTTQLGNVPIQGAINFCTVAATGSLNTTALPHGPNTITAQYSGDTNYSGSTSPPISINVFYGTGTTLTSSNPTVLQGQSVTFTAQVTTNQTNVPAITGTVQFVVDSAALGAPVSLSNGQAQFTTNTLTPGFHGINANYSGDNNYVPSSGFGTETVNQAFSISANPSNVSIAAPGGSATVTLAVADLNGFSGTVSFSSASCAGLPAQSTCSFNPSSVTGNGNVMLTITTTAPSMMFPFGRPIGFTRWTTGREVTLLGVFCFVFLLLRRRGTQGRRRVALGLAMVLAIFVVLPAGCGGGGGVHNPGTPTGTEQLMITGTSGSISNATSIVLTVQ